MLEYDWPGNLRELDNCLERACTLASGPVIHTRDLPANIKYTPALPERKNSTSIVPMTELERQTILSAIAQLNGDKLMAARLLGIGKTTLYRKLKEYAGQDILDHQAPTFL
jgi:two-component system response regulator HydG